MSLNQTWALDDLFEGGSDSAELAKTIQTIESELDHIRSKIQDVHDDSQAWADLVRSYEAALAQLQDVAAYVSCLTAQDVRDQQAIVLQSTVGRLRARANSISTLLDDQLRQLDDEQFAQLIQHVDLQSAVFYLTEQRKQALDRMPTQMELLANDLAVDGYHSFQTLYNTIVSRISISFDGEQLSVGQAENRFAHPDRSRRQNLFKVWEEAWSDVADLAAHTLNHLAGFRLNVYAHRHWDDVLKEPLQNNRIQRDTIEAMWSAAAKHKDMLTKYLHRKAKLLGVPQLAWYDMDAPIGKSETNLSYEDAAAFIVKQFGTFSSRMADFAERAIRNRWVEAEDRPFKRAGGFCTSFPVRKQSRIFMTFSGTPRGQATLAHELGHAYHAHVLSDLRLFNTVYPMNLAETASTFSEFIVSSAAIEQAEHNKERIALLADRLDDAVAYLMNIHARFLFEQSFYKRRAKQQVAADELNDMMEQAQKKAYNDALTDYHPLFWASKLHFYITRQPFYNFPYTFGYLFSAALYGRAQSEGPQFEEQYTALLRDTGRMRVEDLARKHLGVDITKEQFWEDGLRIVENDVQQFLSLTEREDE